MDADPGVAALAADLVSVPSHEDPTACGDAVESWLREYTPDAVAVTRDEAGNVLARVGSGRSLAFVGHHDVVPPADEQVTADGYAVERRDGRLYGRGSADMKGALAAGLCAFRDALADHEAGELVFASFVGEETGGEGARHAIAEGFAPDCAIVGEGSTGYSAPGATDVAVAHRGRRASTLHARGEAAHASEGGGVNAVYRACDAVDELRTLPVPEATVLGHEMTGLLTVTGVEGGEAWNVVPDRCDVTVDERTVPGGRAPLDRVADRDGVSLTVEQDLPPMACDDPDFADCVTELARREGDAEQVVKPHATDAGWLADAGTTCVVCGPAEPGEAHTDDESVSVAVLERCYRVYRDAFAAWPPGP